MAEILADISNSTSFTQPISNFTTIETPKATETLTKDDAAWILTNSFLILTMQSGFGLLEAGCVASKNIANIMVKNVVDVTLGGITYWTFGYGLAFGQPSNAFCGWGSFLMSSNEADGDMGSKYSHYVFQFSFATAATTIVSGAIAERMRLPAYMLFSMINTFVYCFPSSWAWNHTGFLAQRGFFDFAGACVVHLTGGASAFVAAFMLGPRLGRFGSNDNHGMSSPVTALTGTFMLWWAWLGFNCGSTFGIAHPGWKIAAKVAVNTLNGSIGGGIAGLLLSIGVNYKHVYFDISYIITSILGGLVGVTACCAVVTPAESIVIGAIGALLAIAAGHVLERLGIDDPVGAFAVHYVSAVWATLAVGIFGQNEFDQLGGRNGLLHGGGFRQLGEQALGVLAMTVWSALFTAITFWLLARTIGVRMEPEEEILGADWVEHKVRSENFAVKMEKALENMNADNADVEDLVQKVLDQLAKVRPENLRPVSARVRNITGQQPTGNRDGTNAAASAIQQVFALDEGMRGIPYVKAEEHLHANNIVNLDHNLRSRSTSASSRQQLVPNSFNPSTDIILPGESPGSSRIP